MSAIQLAPDLWVGGYEALLAQPGSPPPPADWKIIVNCGSTSHFLSYLELRHTIGISSDVLMFSLDPRYSDADARHDVHGLFSQFIHTYGKRLQNYLYHYYRSNPARRQLVHDSPSGLFGDMSPIMNGALTSAFFNFNRLVKLIRMVNLSGSAVLIVGDNPSLVYGLAVSYFMDNYSFNMQNCLRIISQKVGVPVRFDGRHYDDMIIADNLQKFYSENLGIKESHTLANSCKRGVDDDEERPHKRHMDVYN
ncbi:hypothetical protein DICA1_E29316 [Diutina catenulata]